ncbi:MAG: DUF1489 family protein [Rhodospirillaceae bacterium]|nr:DUF1489 family protein [Rhodospirillaceae bacterium]
MTAPLHLLRGFVQWNDYGRRGQIKTVDEAAAWLREIAEAGHTRFYTWTSRRPTRGAELKGGSVFFVGGPKRNQALFRMPFVDVYEDGHGYEITMRPELIRVRQDFVGKVRGWRYLEDKDAPPDQAPIPGAGDAPPEMARELKEMGLA